MKFIHIADVHLGAIPDKGSPWSEKRQEEIWYSFRRLIDKVKEEEADLLLIAGDLFHGQPQIRELKEVSYLFSRILDTQVVLILGNHDYMKQDSALSHFHWGENVTCLFQEELRKRSFPQLQTVVYGFGYHANAIKEHLLDDIRIHAEEGCHILLAHGGDEEHLPFDKRKLARSGFDYIALGHIHKPQILEADKIAYAGALEPIDQNDTGEHGYILGEYRDGKLSVSFVPFALREYIHLKIPCNPKMTNGSMQEKLTAVIEGYGKQNIYKFLLTGYRDSDIVFDLKRFYNLGNILSIEDRTEPDLDIEGLYRQHRDDILGKYIGKLYDPDRPMGEIRKKALYLGIRALLSEE